MAKLIKVDGTEEVLKETDLTSLQKAVGGYIETVSLGGGKTMIIDEEGKLKNKKINIEADKLAKGYIFGDDCIVGDVVICEPGELE